MADEFFGWSSSAFRLLDLGGRFRKACRAAKVRLLSFSLCQGGITFGEKEEKEGRLNGLFMAVTGIRRGAIVLIPVNVVLIALLAVLREKSGWGEFVNFSRHLKQQNRHFGS